ncbi:hypothetical protein E2C01_041133 [Portunus trituberculatus]|uniref:Uncharacterized protein n=1 Tax=Portunus trituberculatus TaxID=210409 RepID=A0A5B7FIF1_PORTR|nr:hypothetical protein [Portunus trituberculatus]
MIRFLISKVMVAVWYVTPIATFCIAQIGVLSSWCRKKGHPGQHREGNEATKQSRDTSNFTTTRLVGCRGAAPHIPSHPSPQASSHAYSCGRSRYYCAPHGPSKCSRPWPSCLDPPSPSPLSMAAPQVSPASGELPQARRR